MKLVITKQMAYETPGAMSFCETMFITGADGVPNQFGPMTRTFATPIDIVKFWWGIDPEIRAYFSKAVKYGVTPCPEWIDLYGSGITLDGEIIPAGTVLIIKSNDEIGGPSGTCGVGEFADDGLLKFTPVYGDDRYVPNAKTGAYQNDKLELFVERNNVMVEVKPKKQTEIDDLYYSGIRGERIQLTELVVVK